jgi:hypothetical protein
MKDHDVVLLDGIKPVELAASVDGSAPGPARGVPLPRGLYELRLSGDVVVAPGTAPALSFAHMRIFAAAVPLKFRHAGGQVTLAALATASTTYAWFVPIEER